MPAPSTLWWFITASAVLLLVPGPSVLYVCGRTLDQGSRAGLQSTLGLACGDLVQVLAAVVGLSALVASSETAFQAVKYAGAAYLVHLGVRRLRTPVAVTVPAEEKQTEVPSGRIVLEGLVVNALNPKSTMFFLAFLPAFVDRRSGAVWLQTFVLGLIFVLIGVLTNGGWGLLTNLVRGRAQQSRGFLNVQRYVGGGVFLALAGVVLATGTGD
ncbi:LysE family translocator [Streptomyces sp. NBC_01754]|uniref:LysE family translocator n=1 Tax=Streptomyces sp. NBC_01754 TaxID=2975930 RepID=UPI002DDB6A57|nr:LysE family translocator [Streptomyces sp. NBC_01754]WSC93383.1 LysE family translocator [Streptomyces sp. NBC_01754]